MTKTRAFANVADLNVAIVNGPQIDFAELRADADSLIEQSVDLREDALSEAHRAFGGAAAQAGFESESDVDSFVAEVRQDRRQRGCP